MTLRFKTLTARLTLLVISLLVVLAAASGGASYLVTEGLIESFALSSLSALATSKKNALDHVLASYDQSLRWQMLDPPTQRMLATLDPADRQAVSSAGRELWRRGQDLSAFHRVDMMDPSGKVVLVSTDQARVGRRVEAFRQASRCIESAGVLDVVFEDDQLDVRTCCPIRRDDGGLVAIGVGLFRAHDLLEITGDYNGLGRTGEVVLGRRQAKTIRFLAPLRFAPDAQNLPSVSVDGKTAKPMIHATAGQSGMVRAPDYRDAQVVAAFRPLKSKGWGLVVKQDEEEVYAGVRRLRDVVLGMLGIVIIVSMLVIVPLLRRFTQPIVELARATDKVAEGQLDVAVRSYGDRDDEVGRLASSFNRMVQRLQVVQRELSQSHDELLEQTRALTRANDELEAFTRAVTHDLRTPLVSIRGMSEMLGEELGDGISHDARIYLDHISRSSERMDELLSDLLEVSRVGRMDTSPDWVHSGQVVEQVIREVEMMAPDREIRFVVADDLPELHCNVRRLYQVMSNLISNAVKFTAGSPFTEIEVGWKRGEDGEVIFWVRDDGPGIPRADHGRIFGLFERLHGPEIPGAGLGLSLVKRIVTTMGGWIRIESEVGEGATFMFAIPSGPLSDLELVEKAETGEASP